MNKYVFLAIGLLEASQAFSPLHPVKNPSFVACGPRMSRLGMVQEEKGSSTALLEREETSQVSEDQSISMNSADETKESTIMQKFRSGVRRVFGRGDREVENVNTVLEDEPKAVAMVETPPANAAAEPAAPSASVEVTAANPEEPKQEEKESDVKNMLQQIKESGKAGVISYALWELGFWLTSIPIALFGYYELAGHWPDFSNSDDMAKLGAEAFAFVNFARFAVPLRIGLALSTTGWVKENVVDRFFPDGENEDEQSSE